MTIRKRIPTDEEGYDLLLQNLNEKCPGYKTVLNISGAQLSALDTNATCYHACRLLKNQLNDTKVSLTKFIEKLFSGSSKEDLPPAPNLTFALPTLPAKPGIEEQMKKFIEYLELQDDFTDAIGLDLGFYVETGAAIGAEEKTADFKMKDFSGYRLDVLFSLQGQDALRFSYRVKGTTAWTTVTITSSPYTLEIPPDPDGLAITLEMQAILIKNNKPVGQMSDMKTAIARA
jgi:hypothetical protein